MEIATRPEARASVNYTQDSVCLVYNGVHDKSTEIRAPRSHVQGKRFFRIEGVVSQLLARFCFKD